MSKNNEKPDFNKVAFGFEENKGQFLDEKGNPVKDLLFRFNAQYTSVYLTSWGISYVYYDIRHIHNPKSKESDSINNFKYCRIDVVLEGANINEQNIVKEDALPTLFHYYNHHFPRGIRDVRQFRKITLKNVYPGIDWV